MKYIKFIAIILVSCFATILYSFNYKGNNVDRPKDWIVRSNLDSRMRMISIGLNDKLWVAYSTETGSLYKVWVGGVHLGGAVYGKSGLPISNGNTYMEEPEGNPWIIIANGSEITPEIHYKGHTVLNDQITLKYELHYNNGIIKVDEQPEFYPKSDNKVGFTRVFKTSEIPEGISVGLKMNVSSIESKEQVNTNGKFVLHKEEVENISGKKYLLMNGTLFLKNNEETSISINITPKPIAPLIVETVEKEDVIGALFASQSCLTCHDVDNKIIGPSFRSIASRYRNTKANHDLLIEHVIKGTVGNWGEVPMIPHSELSIVDANAMISYILNIDSASENRLRSIMPDTNQDFVFQQPTAINSVSIEKPGVALNLYKLDYELYGFPQITGNNIPELTGYANILHAYNDDFEKNFKGFERNFAIQASGYLNIKEDIKVEFRLASNDGTRLFIDDKMIIETEGNMAAVKEGVIDLKAGKHPFVYEYYKRGGEKRMSLQWRPYGTDTYTVIPAEVFTFKDTQIKATNNRPEVLAKKVINFPGDGASLKDLHPSFTLFQARPDSFEPKVAGMDFMSDGKLVVSTWDSVGAVYVLDGVKGNNPDQIKVTRVAYGLQEPLGLKVVNDEIYVLQKQELTKLIDLNGDGIIDEYRTINNSWKGTNNNHEFAFGLEYKDGYFYGTLSLALNGPGPSAPVQAADRGKVFKISKDTGAIEFIATGLRTPNGIGFGIDGEMFIADNQGDWLPANKIVHVTEGAWYGSRAGHMEETANMKETLPVVYLEHDKIGNSPSQPAKFNVGPYKNQMIHGDVTIGGIKRVFAEKINGEYQGVVFRFTQGLEAGVNRIIWGPDSALYIGGIGNGGNWGQNGKLRYGLQKIVFNHKSTFEMLSIKAKSNGVEIEFTEPLKPGVGTKATDYNIQQWRYEPTGNYGGPNLDEETLEIKNIIVSPDRKKVTLELPTMKEKYVLYFRLNRETMVNESDTTLWSTEAWYTMNNIPNE
ncbi:PA14 domain-containing protein [Albibacterium bauzanense]|uniref:Cytochrome c n=1 Tax=Albibacterium bauzanense TaxID=653929 RepID=A0A4R1LQW0_9SPHI|nr:PA14 domain-containing protein [Albibacterium bauzanense]TCK80590.1 cytochrome c [Albibacterium bauzanense]